MICNDDVNQVLATILDPEMPINLIDLGIIAAVRIRSVVNAAGIPRAAVKADAVSPGPSGGMSVTAAAPAVVEIDVTPTFVGCPALAVIEREIRTRVGALPGVSRVAVQFIHAPPWSVDRISPAGRAALRAFGVTVPEQPAGGAPPCRSRGPHSVNVNAVGAALQAAAAECKPGASSPNVPLVEISIPERLPECPFCGSSETRIESRFGPTRCKMICYCPACKNTFEHLKRV